MVTVSQAERAVQPTLKARRATRLASEAAAAKTAVEKYEEEKAKILAQKVGETSRDYQIRQAQTSRALRSLETGRTLSEEQRKLIGITRTKEEARDIVVRNLMQTATGKAFLEKASEREIQELVFGSMEKGKILEAAAGKIQLYERLKREAARIKYTTPGAEVYRKVAEGKRLPEYIKKPEPKELTYREWLRKEAEAHDVKITSKGKWVEKATGLRYKPSPLFYYPKYLWEKVGKKYAEWESASGKQIRLMAESGVQKISEREITSAARSRINQIPREQLTQDKIDKIYKEEQKKWEDKRLKDVYTQQTKRILRENPELTKKRRVFRTAKAVGYVVPGLGPAVAYYPIKTIGEEIAFRPRELYESVKFGFETDPKTAVLEIAAPIGVGILAPKAYSYIKGKSVKVTSVKTVSFADEVLPEAIVQTPYGNVKVLLDKNMNIKHYKILSGSKVKIRRWWGLGKEKTYHVQTIGKATIKKTNIPNIYVSKGRFISRLNKQQILGKVRGLTEIKDKVSIALGEGKTFRGKPINRLTKQELLTYLSDQKIILKGRKIKTGEYVYGEVGVRPKIEVPEDISLFLTTAKIKELIKKRKYKEPYIEKGIQVTRRLKKPDLSDEFTVFKQPRPITKIKPKPVVAIPGLEKIHIEMVKREVVKPTRIRPRVAPPRVVVKPSIWEGMGLYERTEEALIPDFTIPGVRLAPRLAPRLALKERALQIRIAKQRLKERAKERDLMDEMVTPAMKVKPKMKERLAVRQIQLQKQALKERQLMKSFFVPKFAPKIAPPGLLIPPPLIPLPKKVIKGKKLTKKEMAKLRRKLKYTPGFFSIATERMAKAAEIPELLMPGRVFKPFEFRPIIPRRRVKKSSIKTNKVGKKSKKPSKKSKKSRRKRIRRNPFEVRF